MRAAAMDRTAANKKTASDRARLSGPVFSPKRVIPRRKDENNGRALGHLR